MTCAKECGRWRVTGHSELTAEIIPTSVLPTNGESGWLGGGGWERLLDGTQLVSGIFLKVSRVLAFTLKRAFGWRAFVSASCSAGGGQGGWAR